MKLKDKITGLIQKLSFTQAELKTILFISVIIIAGFSIKYVKHLYSDDKPYNYTTADLSFKSGAEKYTAINDTGTVINLTEQGNDTLTEDIRKELEEKIKTVEDSVSSEIQKNKKGKKEAALEGKTIDINTATKEELISLPGIGEAMAERIINYRNDHNGFKKPEDIMKVKGIGKKKFNKLKEYITVN
ncbi:MAG: helix-hairpin-helix domain-containing protein [Ignavibacteria bacterium]|nr:helix-hairpin-helix domain-containing protein [Ignavibacteria bacterium]